MPEPTTEELAILNSTRHVLVLGGPGSGKTTLALKKAVYAAKQGLKPGQSVLFLSFSRSAIGRLAEAGASQIPRDVRDQISLQTFHSFCWSILKAHGYLLGTPMTLQVLLPHDERSLSSGAKQNTKEGAAWEQERDKLFLDTGRTAFDLFAPKTLELLTRCAAIKRLVVQQHPIVIVDEAQDTGEGPWQIIQSLKDHVQIICLGDLDQQIFDHLPGVGPERIEAIRKELKPLEIDLGHQNNRSPGTEISLFANHVLAATPSGGPYDGVSRLGYAPKADMNLMLRRALAIILRKVRKRAGQRPDSVAILAPYGKDAALISAALAAEQKPVAHKIVFDEAKALLASRFAAFLLEPKRVAAHDTDLGTSLDYLAAVERAAGTKGGRTCSDKYRKWASDLAKGKKPVKNTLTPALTKLLTDLRSAKLTGDPRTDWLYIKSKVREAEDKSLKAIAGQLDYLVAFGRGRLLAANLAALWTGQGTYAGARAAFDSAMAQDAILDASQEPGGIHVMTIHKSKGKQFDAVIVVRKSVPIGKKKWRSSFVWPEDLLPHPKSRKILRVAITRARKEVLILEPAFPNCPILKGHKL
ncbi:MAG: UvrD-helicase domain-containing protein [Hyphomicrobiaceae bacterium]|nr:UvrD-helicase domain-containing protein [Hyphomicrobiaceae bacterium]